jgi:hypothetical protein
MQVKERTLIYKQNFNCLGSYLTRYYIECHAFGIVKFVFVRKSVKYGESVLWVFHQSLYAKYYGKEAFICSPDLVDANQIMSTFSCVIHAQKDR